MSCAAHRSRNRGRILCFECYRARIDRPERVKLVAAPFPRVLSAREIEHRRRMLQQLQRA
jgi:recombinational DNA repair protein (RecF pathway)